MNIKWERRNNLIIFDSWIICESMKNKIIFTIIVILLLLLILFAVFFVIKNKDFEKDYNENISNSKIEEIKEDIGATRWYKYLWSANR